MKSLICGLSLLALVSGVSFANEPTTAPATNTENTATAPATTTTEAAVPTESKKVSKKAKKHSKKAVEHKTTTETTTEAAPATK